MSGRRSSRRTASQSHRRRLRLGATGAALILLGTLFAFTKQIPFLSHGYEIRAVFASTGQLTPGSEVRIAGLPVGKVTALDPGPKHTALVTMQIEANGRPVHADATLAIEPRLFLEGSFYVAFSPGSPGSPVLRSGAIVPLAQTSVPVQLDQVFDVFNAPVRSALTGTLNQVATGLGTGPDGGSGAGGLRGAVRQLANALPSATQVAQSAQGTDPGDLTDLITSSAATTEQLASNPVALGGLVTDTDRVTAALAANTTALGATVPALDSVLRVAPGALSSLDRALPTLRTFALDLQPALRAAPTPLRQTSDLLRQVQGLVSTPELPGLLNVLTPVSTTLPTLEQRLHALFQLVTPVSRCVSTHVIPVLSAKLDDGSLSTAAPAWLDLLHAGAGLSGISSDFDANGVAIRLGATVGDQTLTAAVPGLGSLVGSTTQGVEGTDPRWLGPNVQPPMRPDMPCLAQALPDLTARRETGSGGTAMTPTPTTSTPSPAALRASLRHAVAAPTTTRSTR